MLLVAVLCMPRYGAGSSVMFAGLCAAGVTAAVAISLSAFVSVRHISRLLLWLAVGCGLGFHNAYTRSTDTFAAGLPPGSIVEIEGYVKGDPMPLQGGRSLVRVCATSCGDGEQRATASGILSIFLRDRPELSNGQYISAGISYPRHGIDGNWFCSATGDLRFHGWRSQADRFRALSLQALRRILDSTRREADFLAAVLFGIREDPADPFVEKFRRAGVSHVLALSGMHLGIVAGFLLVAAKPFFSTGKAYLLSLPLLGFYVWLVGFKPSLLRAAVMYLLASTRIVGNRRPDSLSLLAIALICVLEIDPGSPASLSFQLSFLALLGIMTVGSDIAGPFSAYLPRALSLPLAMSVGAQIATAPVVAARFGAIYPVGVVASMVITPVIVVYLWAGLIFVLLSLASLVIEPGLISIILSQSAIHVMEQARRLIGSVVTGFAQVPGIPVEPGAALAVGVAFALYLIWRAYIEYRYKGR